MGYGAHISIRVSIAARLKIQGETQLRLFLETNEDSPLSVSVTVLGSIVKFCWATTTDAHATTAAARLIVDRIALLSLVFSVLW